MNDFLPDEYTPPSTDGKYTKLKQGANRLRILDKPILGYLSFVDSKPVRARTAEECPAPSKQGETKKHFWAMPVFNYDAGCIQIWEITQATIQDPITTLSRNPDWGSPVGYGITVTKSGESLETKYQVIPSPHKPLPEEIATLYAATPINLQALFAGADPFESGAPTPAPAPVPPPQQAPPPQPTALAPEFDDDIPF